MAVRRLALIAAALGVLSGCEGSHPVTPATPAAATPPPSEPPPAKGAEEAFRFRHGEMSAPIYLPRKSTCVVFSISPIEGSKCPPPEGTQTDLLAQQGLLLTLTSVEESGTIGFSISLHASPKGSSVERNAFVRVLAADGWTLVANQSPFATTKLSSGVVIERFSFDTEQSRTTLAFSHLVLLAIPSGGTRVYALSWHSTRARAGEVEASADRALNAVRRSMP